MQTEETFKPLSRLFSLGNIKEVDSPRSERSAEKISQIFSPIELVDHPSESFGQHDLQNPKATSVTSIQQELQFSINQLFSKIQRIKSEFTPNQEPISPLYLKHSNSTKSEPVSYEQDWRKVLESRDQNIPISVNQYPLFKKNSLPIQKKIVIEDFQLGKTLGSGKFGDVLQCRHKATGTMYAVKKIFKSTIMQYKMIDQLVQQLKIHYNLQHLNIVKLYGHFEDYYHIFLLMQYLDGNILMNLQNRQESYVSDLIFQTLKAVEYLHRRQIAHRDIKPENIILTHGIVKLCDFGWAASCDTGMKKTFCGTLDYVSPEILQEREYSISVDLWSIGVLTFELLVGFAPFNHQIPKMKMNKIKNIDKETLLFPPQISPDAKDFINKFLKKDPSERMCLKQALNHSFINKYRKQHECMDSI